MSIIINAKTMKVANKYEREVAITFLEGRIRRFSAVKDPSSLSYKMVRNAKKALKTILSSDKPFWAINSMCELG